MRLIRGVPALVNYLESINCYMSESTIYRLVRRRMIPFKRPTQSILIFDLNAIDKWLTYEDVKSI